MKMVIALDHGNNRIKSLACFGNGVFLLTLQRPIVIAGLTRNPSLLAELRGSRVKPGMTDFVNRF